MTQGSMFKRNGWHRGTIDEVVSISSSVSGLSALGDVLLMGLRLDKERGEAVYPTCPAHRYTDAPSS